MASNKQAILTRNGGCELYDGCRKCREAHEIYVEDLQARGSKGGKAKVPKGRNWRKHDNEIQD